LHLNPWLAAEETEIPSKPRKLGELAARFQGFLALKLFSILSDLSSPPVFL
jgi:hypothetical protein